MLYGGKHWVILQGGRLLELFGFIIKMAVSSSKGALSMGQKLWSALSAWAINNAGYQKYGEALDQPRGTSADLLRPCRQCRVSP